MLSRLAASVLLLASCGRLEFEPTFLGDHDAGIDGAVVPAVDSGMACDPTAPFGSPTRIAELSSATEPDGTLRLMPDELSGYFWRGTPPAQDIFLAERPDVASPFTVVIIQGLNSDASNDLDPTISSDGQVMVFRRNGPGDDLYLSTATSPSTFTAATALTGLNSASADAQGFMPIGRDELYFQSRRTGAGDIYMATRNGTTFVGPSLVAGVNTADEEGDPVITPDGLTIYFRSDRPSAAGGFNIYTATRATPTGTFGPATLVPNVNTDDDDGPSWISLDGCRLYISSNAAGTNDVYVATRGM